MIVNDNFSFENITLTLTPENDLDLMLNYPVYTFDL